MCRSINVGWSLEREPRYAKKKTVTDRQLGSAIAVLLLIWLVGAILQNPIGQLILIVCVLGILAAFVYWRFWLPRIHLHRLRALKIDDVDAMPGREFEHYVARLLQHQGFKTRVTKVSGDLGVDVIAKKNGVSYAVQCKRYNDDISRAAISDAVGGKSYYKCTEAMVVTNRHFTKGAKELAKSNDCILVDRDQLAAWVLDFQTRRDT